MDRVICLVAAIGLSTASAATAVAEICADKDGGIGVSRIIEIDTSAGPLYGDMSMLAKEQSFLGPKEVVLTFDDGPMPAITRPILDTLDKFCTKATFFSVGRMAIAYPAMTKEVMARGHTLGTHTWSHPFHLRRAGIEKARDEIERGFSAVSMAAGQPIAPFFRFPGLADSNPMMAHLQSRGIAAFTVDVVSNDSYIGDPRRLTERTISHTVARDGGILLFHDIKHSTAKALPEILRQLKERGFKVVHLRPKQTYTPVKDYDEPLAQMMAKTSKPVIADATAKPALIPFTAAVPPEVAALSDTATGDAPPVTQLVAEAKDRGPAATPKASNVADDTQRRRQRVANSEAEPRVVKVRAGTARTKRNRAPKESDEPKRFFD
jgi:peptidoglycan/xylan/chitin deacetylase (PgdA/CDA1 family)